MSREILKLRLLGLLILIFTGSAFAEDSYESSFEDTVEFLAPPVEPVVEPEVAPKETWSYSFELVRPNGSVKVLTEQKRSLLLKPASTMKLFTGWWAFQRKNRTDAYLGKMLKESDNVMAENTVQRLGGVFAMEDYFRDAGLPLDESNFNAADGSGLSYDNQANCEIEIALLKKIKANKSYLRFKKLLAQPKQDGTLKTRLTAYAGKVFAKTGTLARTAALSGFLETPKGTVVFCVMGDYLNSTLVDARKKIDAMVRRNYALAK